MARARNIKPGFFSNEYLADLSFEARLLFIGLWTIADKRGRLEDRPKGIKGKLFPFDNLDVDALLNELASSPEQFIIRYEVDEKRYIQIANFEKHQNPHHRETESTIPAPDKPRASLGPAQDKPQTSPELAVLIPDSLNLIPDSPTPPPPDPPAVAEEEAPDGAKNAVVAVVRAWDKISGKIATLHDTERLMELLDKHGEQRLLEAIRIAGDNGKYTIAYLEGIFRNEGNPPKPRGQPYKKPAERTNGTWLNHHNEPTKESATW